MLEVSTTPSMAGPSAIAAAAADTVPRLVPTSHTGLPVSARTRSTTRFKSCTCSGPARNARSRSSWSLGLPAIATSKPAAANMSRLRTRKLVDVGTPPFMPMPPALPGSSTTAATASGRSIIQ